MPSPTRSRKIIVVFALACLAMIFIGIYQSLQPKQCILLGKLGGKSSIAADISDNGQIVGNLEDQDGNLWVFLWTKAKGMTDLKFEGPGNVVSDADQHIGCSLEPTFDRSTLLLFRGSWGVICFSSSRNEPSSLLRFGKETDVLLGAGTIENRYTYYTWTPKGGRQQITKEEFFSNLQNLPAQAPEIKNIQENGKYRIQVVTPKGTQLKLPLLGGEQCIASAVNNHGQIAGTVIFGPPWWVHAWDWLGQKCHFPEKYRPILTDYGHAEAALWTIPSEE